MYISFYVFAIGSVKRRPSFLDLQFQSTEKLSQLGKKLHKRAQYKHEPIVPSFESILDLYVGHLFSYW